MMHHHPRGATPKSQSRIRRAWRTPRVERIRAGEAENGSLNLTSDGSFTFAS